MVSNHPGPCGIRSSLEQRSNFWNIWNTGTCQALSAAAASIPELHHLVQCSYPNAGSTWPPASPPGSVLEILVNKKDKFILKIPGDVPTSVNGSVSCIFHDYIQLQLFSKTQGMWMPQMSKALTYLWHAILVKEWLLHSVFTYLQLSRIRHSMGISANWGLDP